MNGVERTALVLGLSIVASGCGRKGPLIYPDMLVPAAPAAVTAQQSGSAVKLQFVIPDKNRAGRPVRDVAGVKISRRTTEADQADVCPSCMNDYRLFQTLYVEHLPANAQRYGNLVVVIDGDVSAGSTYSYSVLPFTTGNVDGASAQTGAVSVVAALPAPLLKIESLPTELKLQISLPFQIRGTLLGYNLYRSVVAAAQSYQPLNRKPVENGEYVDSGLDRGVMYRYSARVLIKLKSGTVAESAASNEVEGMLKDDE